jgi:uncharacterized protein
VSANNCGNRLASEKSPYLLQHADNPVDWYPWGDEAFKRAQTEDKPIFLSIGYSTCHWCHVMERESFEDQEIARMLNDVFVCIKVDREERPDIDGVYMNVCQMMTGSGGWPLTIFLLPDKRPFFAATYIPKHAAYSRIGLIDLIPHVGMLWRTRRSEIEKTAEQALTGIKSILDEAQGTTTGNLDARTLNAAYEALERGFDGLRGGFGTAPKFPTPHNLVFLLRYYHRTGQRKALAMVEKTLQSMRMGGIYDHLGFGFHRYSTDASWLTPHFEKMLYDQALMAMAYTEAYQLTKKAEYERTLREIFTYVLRDMTSPDGAFYSAEDADSEGKEGKFYLWEEKEIRILLEDEEARVIIEAFCVKGEGNAAGLDDAPGQNILHVQLSLDQVASRMGVSVDLLGEALESGRRKLLRARNHRVRPLRDDKILTDWNGLMCVALAKGGQILGDETYVDAARRSMGFILTSLRSPDGRLLHRFRDGHAAITATADDYAFAVWALIELYEATFDASHLETALNLTDLQVTHFWDPRGGFFFTPDDGEPLPIRQKEIYDGAIPSSNSVAMLNLLRLSRMTGRQDLEEKSRQLADVFAKKVDEFPTGYTQLLQGLDFALGPAFEIVLSGVNTQQDMGDMMRAIWQTYAPNTVVLFIPEHGADAMISLAPFAASYRSIGGKATAYVCRGHECSLPTTDASQMLALLNA